MLSSVIHAEEVFPNACKPLAVKGEFANIPSGKPRLIMLHNLSGFDVWVARPFSEKENAGGWSSRLQANHWSALYVEDETFELSCIESRPGHEQQVACEQALGVCEWPITSKPENIKDILMVGENMPLTALTAYIGRQGFELPPKA